MPPTATGLASHDSRRIKVNAVINVLLMRASLAQWWDALLSSRETKVIAPPCLQN